MQNQSFTYLALGDSYTIGESVKENERWPMQLVQKLANAGVQVDKPEIVATTGWTTDELMSAISRSTLDEKYDLVSLLIGVNNQYRDYPPEQYDREFKELLLTAINFAGSNPNNVFVVSIPDYGVTPFAKAKNLSALKIKQELEEYNATARQICEAAGVRFIDITPGSRLAMNDPSLIAEDGLHPSGKMYSQWVDLMYTSIYDNLSSR